MVQDAPCVIAMDCYLDQYRLNILEKYAEQPAYLIHNEYQSRSNHTVHHTRHVKSTVTYIQQSLTEGRRIVCPCMSKTQAEKAYSMASLKFGDSKHMLLYTRDSTWKGEDVNEVWARADVLVHTSTIGCCISLEVADHFDMCVCLFDNSIEPTVGTALQKLSRSRDTRQFPF